MGHFYTLTVESGLHSILMTAKYNVWHYLTLNVDFK